MSIFLLICVKIISFIAFLLTLRPMQGQICLHMRLGQPL